MLRIIELEGLWILVRDNYKPNVTVYYQTNEDASGRMPSFFLGYCIPLILSNTRLITSS